MSGPADAVYGPVMHVHPQLLVLTVASLLLLAACSTDDGDDAGDAVGSSSATEAPTPTESPIVESSVTEPRPTETPAPAGTEVALGDTPAEAQLGWFVAALNADGPPEVAEVEDRFSEIFLSQIPAETIPATVSSAFAAGEAPYRVVEVQPAADGQSAEAIVEGANQVRFGVQIAVELAEPHRITGLLISPLDIEFPTPITVDAIDDRLTDLGDTSAVALYDVTDGTCDAVHQIRPETAIPLGSVFKLWVLAELANQVATGDAAWDETVPVVDSLRSSPDGEIFFRETGTEITLAELAEAMIAISDNTATDHLIDRLGREEVEAALDRIGIADPAANQPLLSTGNLFQLKFVAAPPNAADYRALDEAGRRALLAELDDAVLPWVADPDALDLVNGDGVPIDQPRDLDVEWFATPADLCRTMVHLAELAETPGLEPVAEILELNPGLTNFDRDRWPTIRFKGGSEPGVVAGAWWFEGEDGSRYVVAGGVSDADDPVGELDGVLVVASIIELVP